MSLQTTDNLHSVYFTSKDTGFITGNDGIYTTSNAGLNWTLIGTYIASIGNVTANMVTMNSIFFIDANTGYAAGITGHILKTTDKGATWNDLGLGLGLGIYAT